jgi:hypothetical protein
MAKQNLWKITFLSLLSAGIISALLNLSGCTDILGINPNYAPYCQIEFGIEGPDLIFFDPCEPLDVEYQLTNDGTLVTPDDFNIVYSADFHWEISGDADMVSTKNVDPLLIRAATKDGKATISFIGPVGGGDCPTAEHDRVIYATKDIIIVPSVYDVTPKALCTNVFGFGEGTLSIVDPVPSAQQYLWVLTSGNATLSPSPGVGNTCKIDNAQGNITITVQKVGKKCVSDPVVFSILISNCN